MKGKIALLLMAIMSVNIFLLHPAYASPDTFGKTDVGGAEYSWGGNYILGCRFQLTNAGGISKVTAYVASWGNIKVVAAIYSDVNGKVGSLKAESDEVSVGDSFAWKDFALSVSLEAGYYWLVLWSSGNIRYRYDGGAPNQFVLYYQTGYDNWPDPFPSAGYYSNSEMSIYATYTVRPSNAATIRGAVTDSETGNPIQGVTVTCDGASTLTASDGTYSFIVTLGSYTLTFEKAGYITETRTQDCPTEGEYVVDVSLEPVPTATIRGIVTDSGTGNPIQGVTVTCDGMPTQTASDGTCLFIVNLGSYALTFSKTGYATETRTQNCPTVGEYVVNVSLRLLTATIRGTVTDSKTGAPIAEVNVTVDGMASALTTSDGTYSFSVNLGSHTLTFKKSGYATVTKIQNCPTEGEYILNVSMSLSAPAIFSDGFESGTGAWDFKAGATSVTSGAAHHGNYGLRANPAAWFDGYVVKDISSDTVFIRWYVRVGKLPGTNQWVNVGGLINTAWNYICYVSYYNEAGTKYLRLSRWFPSNLGTNYEWNYEANRWYCFELKFVKSATAGEYRLWMDGVEIASQTGLDTSGCGTVGRVCLGVFKNTSYAYPLVDVDCVVIANTYIGQEPE